MEGGGCVVQVRRRMVRDERLWKESHCSWWWSVLEEWSLEWIHFWISSDAIWLHKVFVLFACDCCSVSWHVPTGIASQVFILNLEFFFDELESSRYIFWEFLVVGGSWWKLLACVDSNISKCLEYSEKFSRATMESSQAMQVSQLHLRSLSLCPTPITPYGWERWFFSSSSTSDNFFYFTECNDKQGKQKRMV